MIAAALAGCGGGGGSSSAIDAGTDALVLGGSVGDGPIVNAHIEVLDAQGARLAEATSDGRASYRIEIPRSAQFPLTVTASGGTDLVTGDVPDFTMQSVAVSPLATGDVQVANLNPFTTLIVQTAARMPGGANAANLNQARDYVLSQLSFGLNSETIPDPVGTSITADNIAEVVRASEAFGETIRRVRDALIASGAEATGDAILAALAGDLTDGLLDGQGAGSSARVAATVRVVAGQVAVETIGNRLQVNGADAVARMDDAIETVEPGAAGVGHVPVTARLLSQARNAVTAAKSLAASEALSALETVLEQLLPNTPAIDTSSVVPSDAGLALHPVIELVAVDNADRHQVVNGGGVPGTDPIPVETPGEQPGGSDDVADGGTGGGTGGSAPEAPGNWFQQDSSANGLVVLEAESHDRNLTQGAAHEWVQTMLLGAGAMEAAPNNGGNYDGDTVTQGPRLDFEVSFARAGKHYVWVRGQAASGTDDSVHVGIDGTASDAARLAGFGTDWTWSRTKMDGGYATIDVPAPGVHTVNVWMREDGFGLDKILVSSSSNYAPSGEGPMESARSGVVAPSTRLATSAGVGIDIDVLSAHAGVAGTVSLIGEPAHGTASVGTDNKLAYVPDASYVGEDRVTYKITAADGTVTIASVGVNVVCAGCSLNPGVTLAWDANPDAILGYMVYYGPSEASADQMISQLTIGSPGVDASAPSVTLQAAQDLKLLPGDPVCFRVRAYHALGTSGYSEAACTVL